MHLLRLSNLGSISGFVVAIAVAIGVLIEENIGLEREMDLGFANGTQRGA